SRDPVRRAPRRHGVRGGGTVTPRPGDVMPICVIGTGYVGLVAGACFAESGHVVACVDNNTSKVAQLANGIVGIHEPGLPSLVSRNLTRGRLAFTSDLARVANS